MRLSDSAISPFTGLTREHWEDYGDGLLEGAHACASASYAQVNIPGRHSLAGPASDGLEGYARTFLLAAFRIAGDGGQGPRAAQLIDRYAAGLAAGSDRTHAEAWPRIDGDRPSQPMVEAASIALGLHVTRAWLWERLDPGVQERVVDWLAGFVGRETWPNNWVLFQTVVEEFLASVGGPHREAEILRGLDAMEKWYLGNGWYTDGADRRIDYYNAWAFHLYPLFWTDIADGGARSDRAAELRNTYRERLRSFLADYVHLVAADGAPVHQGRSLIYRFAAAVPFWTGAMFDCSPLSPGLARRAASGMLLHFARNSVPDRHGLLTLGWHREFLPMTQEYSGPASPYWASKAFCGLLLPKSHPVWTAPEEPLPVELGDGVTAIPSVGWLVQGTRDDGIVRLHNHGSDRQGGLEPEYDDPHYAKLSYSSRTAPQTSAESWNRNVDGQLVLLDPDASRADARALRRGRIHPLLATQQQGVGHAASWHTPFRHSVTGAALPVTECRIETHTIAWSRYEIRVHFVTAPAGWGVRDGGYSLASDSAHTPYDTRHWHAVRRDDGTASAIASLWGFEHGGLHRESGADAMGRDSVVPYLTAHHAGGARTYVSCVLLDADGFDPEIPAGAGLAVHDERVTLTLPGLQGSTVITRLGPEVGES
ncbi:DUF2264 domain-containing protein [Streptomyces sp. NBC_00243]|uniref:DUF2264 domain-containing protein n=1 Tax=Streptomyces sp. NBC_00243 TaxID=2975688 RepID=UPI002DDB94E2|nr:DUF2264 domain-containing protein [Streptomyces sp. NBC_00243]WRZ17246.1 DUF2264 domain-containing protein [Streptomyces sp. NBC_00243]